MSVLSSEGVPDIVPSVVLKASPAGRVGEMDHEVMVPVTVGVTEVIAVPLVNTNVLGS